MGIDMKDDILPVVASIILFILFQLYIYGVLA